VVNPKDIDVSVDDVSGLDGGLQGREKGIKVMPGVPGVVEAGRVRRA
jgi:hypothetical protein